MNIRFVEIGTQTHLRLEMNNYEQVGLDTWAYDNGRHHRDILRAFCQGWGGDIVRDLIMEALNRAVKTSEEAQ